MRGSLREGVRPPISDGPSRARGLAVRSGVRIAHTRGRWNPCAQLRRHECRAGYRCLGARGRPAYPCAAGARVTTTRPEEAWEWSGSAVGVGRRPATGRCNWSAADRLLGIVYRRCYWRPVDADFGHSERSEQSLERVTMQRSFVAMLLRMTGGKASPVRNTIAHW